ncbi:MAG: type II secretion system protein GspG [Planctomycetota bacterium]|nr:type II secretion system protein GspG [Planctomycetota bacterium]
MARIRKLYKKYERHFLLGIVILLLASFSITGAFSCQPTGPSGSYKLGGSYTVAPGERDEISDEEFDRLFAKHYNFQYAIRMPSREFRLFLEGLQPPDNFKAAWGHLITLAAAREAGYDAGDHQVRGAVEDMVGFALLYRARMAFSDVNYQQFLRQNFSRGSQAEFQEGVREVVIKDQFLYPLVTSARYQVPYAQAYEAWRAERERVDLQYVALPAEPFAEVVKQEESTRMTIGEQTDQLAKVVNASAQVRRVRSKIDNHKNAKGALPAKLEELGTPAQPFDVRDDEWGNALRYAVDGETYDVRSAGPDGEFDTADDVNAETQKQLDTHSALHELAEKIGQRRTATGSWPKSLEELKAGGDDRLPGLVRDVKDGWEREFTYTPGEGDAAPTLVSLGPDGEAGTADDISLTLQADLVRVVPGPALQSYVSAEAKDSWGRPLVVRLSRAQPPTWQVSSAGADGEDGNEDDLTTGNAQEVRLFFNSVRGDYALPARTRFETLFTHLPLITDEALKRLWDKYPQHRPTDEEKVYEWWRSYKGENFFYRAEDPRDPEAGHGAELAKKVAPEARVTLVPAKDIFPDPLSGAGEKKDEPKKDDAKKDAPKDGEKKDEPAKDAEAEEADAEDRKTFRDQGWREIVIRELFMESLLNDILTRCRDSRVKVNAAEAKLAAWTREREAYEKALAAWEQANADKPEDQRAPKPAEPKAEKPVVPEELTLESVLAAELAELVDSGDANTPAAVQYWRTPELMSREEWEKNENFGQGLQFELSRLKEDGDYNGIPAQLNSRLTKVLVRRLEFKEREPQEYEAVQDKVFERFIERKRMDKAAAELRTLRDAVQKAVDALPADADDAARKAAWDGAYGPWSERIGGHALVENTGLFIGNVPPPAIEVEDDMEDAEKAAIGRRNFVWRAGYSTVRPVASRQDTVTAEPGTFGRRVLRDPKIEERGTGAAYLIRVAERVYPSKAEFSPNRYVEYLQKRVLGDRRRLGSTKRLRDREGSLFQALSRYLDDMDWMQATFDVQTNSEWDTLDERRRR